jgi:very-short-patch-repair endonuclease
MPAVDLHEILGEARKELLDLSARNRLISTPRGKSRTSAITVVGESAAQVFQRLVVEKKSLTFLPGRGNPKANGDGEFDSVDEADAEEEESTISYAGVDQADNRLQTALAAETLQKRLLKLYYDAHTAEEEQGVNILYLALGFLKWYEAPSSNVERFAPLLLVPVALERESARSRFKLTSLDDEIVTNLSLQEKLNREFGVKIPHVPELEDLRPDDYFQSVTHAISDQARWEVRSDDIVLWLFSFAKFLMYRDLSPENWPSDRPLVDHPLTKGLLQTGFGSDPPICGDDEPVDSFLLPDKLTHVVDADSSQAVAVEEVRAGRNLVVQGPPGTGKSQTIVNMIAAAVKEGKTVLFVSEKMAALEVVKQRLDRVGLGPLCLELHSHKSRKQQVLADLKQTLDLTRPKLVGLQQTVRSLERARDRLNQYVRSLHEPIGPTGLTAFDAMGGLVRLRAAGASPIDFAMLDCLSWSVADRETRKRALNDLLLHLADIGPPAEHPWRGVGNTALLPTDIQRLLARVPNSKARWERIQDAAGELAVLLGDNRRLTPQVALELARLARWLAKAPPLDSVAMADEVWTSRRSAITDLVQIGQKLAECRQQLNGIVADVAWYIDVTAARRGLAAHGSSWFRWLFPEYRRAVTQLRGIMCGELPTTTRERIEILDRLIAGQRYAALLGPTSDGDALGRVAFGGKWQADNSKWAELAAIDAWEAEGRETKLPTQFRQLLSRITDPSRCRDLARTVAGEIKDAYDELKAICTELQLDVAQAFAVSDLREIPIDALCARFEKWTGAGESLSRWITYVSRLRKAEAFGLREFTSRLDNGLLAAQRGLDAFEMAVFEAVVRDAFRRFPELSEFNGKTHNQLVDEFRRLDEERIRLARAEVATGHYERLPSGNSAIGEMGVLKWEMQKQRRHKPIRQLLREAGTAVQQIKPVFMMSPISVAQFLQPGVLEFDLLLIDEASQVRPVDALGAVARSRQVVVVGDDKQLPPTRFFSRVLDDQDDDEASDVETRAGDLESILGLCTSRGMHQRMLRWHYRSRHHSLIAVSNREFYDNRLYVVPSSDRASANDGLRFHHIANGVFDRGGTRTNRTEARAVAEAVLGHARKSPEMSLGVGAFSVAQRDAILDELEFLRRESDTLEPFFATGKPDPFFVKNLENIQGDERDVIFISVGYGRDSSGFMSMGFGPLSVEGGERRLNVLISRARLRCEVFSSITDDDIDLGRAQSRGAMALKTFLRYARLGSMDIGIPSQPEFDSEFEAEVAAALCKLGYQVDPQVGVAGFFVDLGLYDPAEPGRYLLGIECDGAAYHSSRSARDRDRLRQQVLEDRGWRIHRIWSTDWFREPDEQLRRVLQAIETARNGQQVQKTLIDGESPVVDRHEPDEMANDANEIAMPYEEARIELNEPRPIHAMPRKELAQIARAVVKVEGPIHEDEIARRIASFWGNQRTGARISAAVHEALQEAVRQRWVTEEGGFFLPTGMRQVPIRNRESVASSSLRKPDMLPPQEVRSALIHVIQMNVGAGTDEAIVQTSRMLGFRSTSGQLKQIVMREVERLVQEGALSERNDRLYAAK